MTGIYGVRPLIVIDGEITCYWKQGNDGTVLDITPSGGQNTEKVVIEHGDEKQVSFKQLDRVVATCEWHNTGKDCYYTPCRHENGTPAIQIIHAPVVQRAGRVVAADSSSEINVDWDDEGVKQLIILKDGLVNFQGKIPWQPGDLVDVATTERHHADGETGFYADVKDIRFSGHVASVPDSLRSEWFYRATGRKEIGMTVSCIVSFLREMRTHGSFNFRPPGRMDRLTISGRVYGCGTVCRAICLMGELRLARGRAPASPTCACIDQELSILPAGQAILSLDDILSDGNTH